MCRTAVVGLVRVLLHDVFLFSPAPSNSPLGLSLTPVRRRGVPQE